MVPAGILDDNPKLAVGEHIFVGSKAHWDVLGEDGAPRFDEGSSGPPRRATRSHKATLY